MEQKINKIYFRADGDKNIGLGHVIRSLALAEMLNQHYECHFLTTSNLHFLENQILAICQSIIQIPKTININEESTYICNHYLNGHEIMVLDGYHFTTNYQKSLKAKGVTLIAIDDIHAIHFWADIIINHSGAVKEEAYQAADYTQFCLGTSFALLRKPFRQKKKIAQNTNYQNNVFICFGGADPLNHTLSTLTQLHNTNQIYHYCVILGGAYAHRAQLEAYISKHHLSIELLSNLNAEEMVKYMQKCSIAITPPSSISYEYLSIGGYLFLVQIADNQDNIKHFLIEKKLAFDFQNFGQVSEKDLSEAITNQKVYFDGQQAKRFLKIVNTTQTKLRKVLNEDCHQVYDWANSPSVRKQSFNSAPIPYENHQKWFNSKLNDKNCHFFMGTVNDIPFGTIRFEVKDGIAIISYSVGEDFRGLGLGTLLLKIGKNKLIESVNSITEIVGYVKKENKASQFAFLKLGYQQTIAQIIDNSYKFSIKV